MQNSRQLNFLTQNVPISYNQETHRRKHERSKHDESQNI
jgi:hypothetical protein